MNLDELRRRLQAAIDAFNARDSVLLNRDVSEWAMAHRLAVYLESLCEEGWSVDCEYNRAGRSAVRPKHNAVGDNIRPDISVHHRGKLAKKHNLLVVEIKKLAEADDPLRVQELTSPPRDSRRYQYQYGVALSFLPTVQQLWCADGRR